MNKIDYLNHKINDLYEMNGDNDLWKIAYYPLTGTYISAGEDEEKIWIDFEEPRALIEKPMINGTDFREVPLRYLNKKPPN